MSDFFSMGGYGAFVWPCFLLTTVVLVWNVIAARRLLGAARSRVMSRRDTGRNES